MRTAFFAIAMSALLCSCATSDRDRGARALSCADVNRPCVQVDTEDPQNVPFELVVSRSANNAFSMELASGASDRTYLIFKCQRMAASNPDCRAPAFDPATGQPLWLIRLTPGAVEEIALAGNLPRCSKCLDQANQNCDSLCSYPYMVVDIAEPSQQPVDPVLIVRR